jgi:hypothetical protein
MPASAWSPLNVQSTMVVGASLPLMNRAPPSASEAPFAELSRNELSLTDMTESLMSTAPPQALPPAMAWLPWIVQSRIVRTFEFISIAPPLANRPSAVLPEIVLPVMVKSPLALMAPPSADPLGPTLFVLFTIWLLVIVVVPKHHMVRPVLPLTTLPTRSSPPKALMAPSEPELPEMVLPVMVSE